MKNLISNMVLKTLNGYPNLSLYHHSENEQNDKSILASWVIHNEVPSHEIDKVEEMKLDNFIQEIVTKVSDLFKEESGEIPELMPNTNPLTKILHKGDEGFTFVIHRHVIGTSIHITYIHACLYFY